MIALFLSALLVAPDPCAVPASMTAPAESLAGVGDADWCLAGDDIFGTLGPDARPSRQIVIRDDGKQLHQIIQWRDIGASETPPSGWRAVLTEKGYAPPGMFEERLIQRLGEHVIVMTRSPAWRVGNAICAGEGGPYTAYLPDGVSASEGDQELIEGLMSGIAGLSADSIMCTSFYRDDDRYRMRFHGPYGRPLLEIDAYYEGTRASLTPPGDFDRHLGINR